MIKISNTHQQKLSPKKAKNMKNLSLNLPVTIPETSAINTNQIDTKYLPFKQPMKNSTKKNPLSLSIPTFQDKSESSSDSSSPSIPSIPSTPSIFYNPSIKNNGPTTGVPTQNEIVNNFHRMSLSDSNIIQQIPEYSDFNMNFKELEQNQLDAYPNGPQKILDNLYLYSEPTLPIIEEFDLVINVAKEIKDYTSQLENSQTEYMFIPWSHTSKISSDLPVLTRKILDSLNQNQKILIHCQCGVSRSATLIIAVLVLKFKLGVNDAYNLLKDKVDRICPNMSLIFELMEFYEYCSQRIFKKNDFENPQFIDNYKVDNYVKTFDMGKMFAYEKEKGDKSYLSPDSPSEEYFHDNLIKS